ncbi:MAG: DEAD/DEAH box helicase [Candidatus Aenigmarchaeota archaeon]|nr:DEAD/DEAH box helicase [Candidatus Aenigmarchaeota archaeon]
MAFIEHVMIKKDTLESRLYQEAILGRAVASDLLCVLPTGLGKTPIAIVLAVFRLQKFPGSKVLVMAPTRPLTEQHLHSFRRVIDLPDEAFVLVTGKMKPESRQEVYKSASIIFATPQTIENDLTEGRINLADFSLLVFDEAHHSIGDYAYPFIAKAYAEQAKNKRILGLTASPGGTKAKIKEIMDNLGIRDVEIRTESDDDVESWVQEKKMEWVYVDLPDDFLGLRDSLKRAYMERLEKLHKVGFRKPVGIISKRDLLMLQQKLMQSPTHDYTKFWGVSLVAQAIKIEHALGLLETQGITSLWNYFRKLSSDKARSSKSVLRDKKVEKAMELAQALEADGRKHPKIGKLSELVSSQLRGKPDSKIIIFANYREMVREIVKSLASVEGAVPGEFMGQKEGMSQLEQKQRIQDFKEGTYNVLVTTSIGEEGIDIPEMELAIFYEPVPSEIRSIQRRGRVGRTKVGRIVILIARRTRDEAYYWTAQKKEGVMKRTLHEMKEESSGARKPKRGQLKIMDF